MLDRILPIATIGIVLIGLVSGAPLAASGGEAAGGGIDGVVASAAAPLSQVKVYAYELAEKSFTAVVSGPEGEFSFERLPAGVYKLIAFKRGFEPAVVMLSRAATEAKQFVELRLEPQEGGDVRSGESYWSVREKVPSDVLRDIETAHLERLATPSISTDRTFRGAVQATTGVDELGSLGAGQVTAGQLGLEGRIGDLRLDIDGSYWHLAGTASSATTPVEGEATNLALRMEGSGRGEIGLTTASHSLGDARGPDLADFERYSVSWTQPISDRSRSRFAAQYTSQTNFFGSGMGISARHVPRESRALNLEGSYEIELSERASVATGVRYLQGEHDPHFEGIDGTSLENRDRAGLREIEPMVELFGRGGVRIQPSVLVEYGLVTRLQDGSFALAPKGTVVVQLNDHWQSIGTVSQRVEDGELETAPWQPIRSGRFGSTCDDFEEQCYRVVLAREEDGERFAVAGVHRELAEALHLSFGDDVFDGLESLLLVQGDEIPELQLVVERKLSPMVLARLESTYGEGGGGILYATDENPYENHVRYLVTSVDTRFQPSATGVFLAFHHLEQRLDPLGGSSAVDGNDPPALERVQLMLSQDLNVLMRLAADWALHVNLEVSRGSLPFSLTDPEDEDLRRRFTGGLSVRF